MAERGTLERGWRKHRLITQLAAGNRDQTDLAREHGVSQPAISQFKSRYAAEIAEQVKDIEAKYLGLWIAEKGLRVAEYQDDVEAINEALNTEPDEKLLRAKLAIMRQVAEELGQLKEQIELTGRMTYAIEGIDMSALL